MILGGHLIRSGKGYLIYKFSRQLALMVDHFGFIKKYTACYRVSFNYYR
jgi:hypothetical protein